MSITHELREYFGKSKGMFTDHVLAIADRIDAEHDESMAWDRVRKAEAENAKLRELVRDALMPRLLYGIYRCPDEDMPIGDAIEWADSELRSRAEELGVELEMEV